MEGAKRNRKKRFNLSDMSDEQVQAFMDSVSSDEEDGDFSADEESDPDYEPEQQSYIPTTSVTGDNVVIDGLSDLGATANVVVRLSQTIPDFHHHILYFDNFYTSMPLMVYLRARGIYSLGTVRSNRIPNCKLPADKDIADEERANPNQQTAKTPHYDRKQKQFIEMDCLSTIIREYNSHMGGVDLMDGLMGRYHIRAKTRDPMTRLFYHFIDMAATNSYVLYHRILAEQRNDSNNVNEEKPLELPAFREEIAAGLVAYQVKRVGRPPTMPQDHSSEASSVGKRAQHPVDDIRFDGYDHLPKWLDKEGGKKKCKLCKTSQTQCTCDKCNIHLCCSNAKNCFSAYHRQ